MPGDMSAQPSPHMTFTSFHLSQEKPSTMDYWGGVLNSRVFVSRTQQVVPDPAFCNSISPASSAELEQC